MTKETGTKLCLWYFHCYWCFQCKDKLSIILAHCPIWSLYFPAYSIRMIILVYYFFYVPFITMIPISRQGSKSTPKMKDFQHNIFLLTLQIYEKYLWTTIFLIIRVDLPPLLFGGKTTFILKDTTSIYDVIRVCGCKSKQDKILNMKNISLKIHTYSNSYIF